MYSDSKICILLLPRHLWPNEDVAENQVTTSLYDSIDPLVSLREDQGCAVGTLNPIHND